MNDICNVQRHKVPPMSEWKRNCVLQGHTNNSCAAVAAFLKGAKRFLTMSRILLACRRTNGNDLNIFNTWMTHNHASVSESWNSHKIENRKFLPFLLGASICNEKVNRNRVRHSSLSPKLPVWRWMLIVCCSRTLEQSIVLPSVRLISDSKTVNSELAHWPNNSSVGKWCKFVSRIVCGSQYLFGGIFSSIYTPERRWLRFRRIGKSKIFRLIKEWDDMELWHVRRMWRILRERKSMDERMERNTMSDDCIEDG